MKTHTFSIVVGTAACNADCPYCVSKMTRTAAGRLDVNWRRFRTACNMVCHASDGLISVLLTGKGEPLLFPELISDYLREMQAYAFPLIDLQTNGILIEHSHEQLKHWRDQGLTLVCISICDYDPAISRRLMRIKEEFNFWSAVERIHNAGLAVRLNCTMLNDGISTPEQVEHLIDRCVCHGVEQLTLREVARPSLPIEHPAVQFVDEQKPHDAARRLYHYLEMNNAFKLLELPHGGLVYDYRRQNVCIGNCLTSTTDPNDIRQIIFFPDGRITYDWNHLGARLL